MASKANNAKTFSQAKDLSDILQSFRDCAENMRMAEADLREADGEIQDALHKLELNTNLTYRDIAALGKRIAELRRKRRIAKDTMEVLNPMVNYLGDRQPILRDMEKVLGEMRKIEAKHKNRIYVPRSNLHT